MPSVLGVHYNDTITLGAALIAMVGVLIGLYRVALGAKLRATNEIQGKEIVAKDAEIVRLDREASQSAQRLNELGAEKDQALATAAACQATVDALKEQIERMPRYEDVIAFGTEQMRIVNDAASARQEKFVDVVVTELKQHDEHVEKIHQDGEKRAAERHEAQLKALDAIVKRLNGGTI